MNIYDYKVEKIDGKVETLEKYRGKILLVVNIATRCGLTPQLEDLEKLYKKYKDKGVEVIGFPCNQFLEQAPESDEKIENFCMVNYGVSFTNYKKVEVNGENAHPLYKFLKEEKGVDKKNSGSRELMDKLKELNQVFDGAELNWNFTKFLIDRDGNVVERFSPTYSGSELEVEVEKLL